MTIATSSGLVRADVVNMIPQQRAAALELFSHRQRRFGGVTEQLEAIGD